jgi:anti-sigma factor RsiW
MDHDRAAAIKAAERYILDELSPVERDEFEEHYFCCEACAAQLRETAAFADNAAAVMRSRREGSAARMAVPARAAWLMRPQWALAAAVLLVVAAAELIYIRGVRMELAAALTPQAVLSTTLQPMTRSEGDRIAIRPGQAFFEVAMDVDPEAQASRYAYEIRAAGGEVVIRGSVDAPPPGAAIHLLLPAARFRAGSYALRLSPAGGAAPPEEFRFIIQPL